MNPERVHDVYRDVYGLKGAAVARRPREYFAARAPAEPQSWFKPVMATERPQMPSIPAEWTDEQRRVWSWTFHSEAEPDGTDPAIVSFARERQAALDAQLEWDRQHEMARCTQWPWAWADAVLAAKPR